MLNWGKHQAMEAEPPAPVPADRRREKRHKVTPPLIVAFSRAEPLDFLIVNAIVLDVSQNGLGLLANESLEPEMRIEIKIGPRVISGVVRHCEPAFDGYRVGVEISDATELGGEMLAEASRGAGLWDWLKRWMGRD